MKPGAPSVNPTGKRKSQPPLERRDGWINEATGHGTTLDRRMLTRYGVDVVTDLEAKQYWRSEWLCKRIIEVIPGEANRRGWDLIIKDKKRAAAIADRAEEIDLDGAMVRAAEYERAYGGGAIFPVIAGAQGDLKEPLDEARVRKIEALHVLEPQELQPESYYTELNTPKFGCPKTYWVRPLTSGRVGSMATQIVHETRLILFPGKRVSRQTQPGQREGWGDSELNHARQMISDAGLTWGSVATLLHEFGVGVYAIDGLDEMLSQTDGPQQLDKRMQAVDLYKSTLRTIPVGGKDTWSRQATPVSGLGDLLAQQKEWIAAVAGMPVPVLYGQQLGGMQSTGDAEIRTWYASVEKIDATHYKRRRERLVQLLLLEEGGQEPEGWSIESRPLWTPSEKEQAETFNIYADADNKNIAAGVYSADDAANSRYRGDKFGTSITIDWKAREEQKKAEEEMAKQMQTLAAQAPPPGQDNPDQPPGDKPPADKPPAEEA